MPVQTGSWKINSNGTLGTLMIDKVDTHGYANGTLSSPQFPFGTAFEGLWDETGAKLSFIVGDNNTGFVTYTGFLSADQFRMPGIGGSVVFTLAGYYKDFRFAGTGGGTTERSVFGWYAQLAEA